MWFWMFVVFYLAMMIYGIRSDKKEAERKERERERAMMRPTPIGYRERRQVTRAVRLLLAYRRAHEREMEELLLHYHPELKKKVDWRREGF